MKWEVYRRLTPMQQKEWEFKYKDNDIPSFGLSNLVIIYAFVAIFMVTIVMASQLPDKFPFYASFAYFMWATKLTTVLIIIWIAEILYGAIAFAIKKRRENRWLKEATRGFT